MSRRNKQVSREFAEKVLKYCLFSLKRDYKNNLLTHGLRSGFTLQFTAFYLLNSWFNEQFEKSVDSPFEFTSICTPGNRVILTIEECTNLFQSYFLYCYSELTNEQLIIPKPRVRSYTIQENFDSDYASYLPNDLVRELEDFIIGIHPINPMENLDGCYDKQDVDAIDRVLDLYWR